MFFGLKTVCVPRHVHPHTMNVYDFSDWATDHPGNAMAESNNRSNPITKAAAEQGSTTLRFPSFHPMTRWATSAGRLRLLGTVGSSIDFAGLAAELQTPTPGHPRRAWACTSTLRMLYS